MTIKARRATLVILFPLVLAIAIAAFAIGMPYALYDWIQNGPNAEADPTVPVFAWIKFVRHLVNADEKDKA